MKLLTIGDSFTYGLELEDPGRHAWPVLLGEKLNAELVNISVGGASNNMMFRECVEQLCENRFDIVIVSWTDPSRIEISRHDRPFSVNYSSRMLDLVPWIEDYYRYNHNDELSYRHTLTMMLALQSFLEQRNQRYLFASAFGIQDLNQQFLTKYKKICSQINITNYLGWPSNGMVEWMGDCPKGPGGHPLELGHQRIAGRINEHIRNLGWIS